MAVLERCAQKAARAAMAEQGDLYFDPDAPDADVDDYGALLTTHLTTRRCNNASRSPTPERKMSRREQAARVFVSERGQAWTGGRRARQSTGAVDPPA